MSNLKILSVTAAILSFVINKSALATDCPENQVLGAHTKTCIPASGTCGTNCYYTIDASGNLNVFPIDDSKAATYDSRGAATELYMSKNIVNVNIAEGITGLGYDSFAICDNIESMNLPDSLETIGGCTFQFGGKMAAVIIPPNVKTFSSTARNANIAYYCSENTFSQCGNSAVKYELTDDGIYFIYDENNKIKGLYTDLNSILADTPVESYSTKNKSGAITAKYDGRGNQIASYKYDGAGNLVQAYENGKLVYAKKVYTPAEAAAAVHDSNDNVVSITW